MTYEYRSGSQTLELPNPYSIENRLRFITSGMLVSAGIALLFVVRHRLLGQPRDSWLLPLLSSLILLSYGVRLIVVGLMQLRFFFGRERPGNVTVNLAPLQQSSAVGEQAIPEIAPNQDGESVPARALEEAIRRGALPFAEPRGALNGLLYRGYRGLIYAVPPLQGLAQKQFQVVVIVAAVLLSFAVSGILATREGVLQWLAVGYFLITAVSVLRPLKTVGGATDVTDKFAIGLIVAAVLAPVALVLIGLPPMHGLRPVEVTLLLLVLVGSAAILFFAALRAQLGEPPPASSSVHQVALSMNCHPSQLSEQLARTLQNAWLEQIPNRRYLSRQPQINTAQQGSGTFVSEVLEETQPFPVKSHPPQTFSECLADPERRPVLLLQAYGAGLLAAAAVGLAIASGWYTTARLEHHYSNFVNLLAYIGVSFIVGRYCFNGAHELFGRFDFESLVYWVEARGSYQVASADFGNVLSDRIHTKKSLINVETATLRVWLVELHSIVFGKDGRRYIRAMVGRKDEAKALAEALVAFAADQSVVVAPTSQQDVQKMAGMAQLSTSPSGKLSQEIVAAALPRPDSSATEEPEVG